ncbi:MAG: TIGR03435 family protein [Terracidiphilus sp.]
MAERVFRLREFRASLLYFAACCAVLTSPLPGQTNGVAPQSPPAQPPTYEVVSVKPHKAVDDGMWWRMTPDGFSTSGVTLDNLMMNAYGLITPDQISGLTGWADADKFDIQAKMDEETTAALQKLSPKERFHQQQLMMRAMLADRFELKVHHETKELPIYELVIARSGLKMKESPANEKGRGMFGPNKITAQATPIESLAFSLSNNVGRIVVDKTGLTGKYDFTLKWTPDDQQESADSGPSIFAALEEQLGLKLVPAKGPVDTIVVDRIEKPSPN